jgi:hypothetical protein
MMLVEHRIIVENFAPIQFPRMVADHQIFNMSCR